VRRRFPPRRGAVNLRVLLLGLLVVAPLVVVLWKAFDFDPHSIASPLIQKSAPDFVLNAVDDGSEYRLSTLRGRPTVINFWATWCEPCKDEHATLLQLAEMYSGKVVFLGVVYQDKPAAIAGWLDEHGRGFPQLVDVGSRTALAYGVYGVPETFVIDAQGTIISKITGPVDGRAMVAALNKLLGAV
jgi:cytochrome c biogenesis protein CcmG/thiol:disulfide interchange protein DsbE